MPGSRLDGVTPLSAHGVMACPSSSAAAVLSQPKCALGAEAVQHSHTRCKMGEKLVVSVSFKEWAFSVSLSKKTEGFTTSTSNCVWEQKMAVLN